MKRQSSSNLFLSFVTVTILTFGFASITCVSSAPHNVNVISQVNALGVSCVESKASSFKPPDQPQFTLQNGERHQYHLDTLPAGFACQLLWNGQESQFFVINSPKQDSEGDWFFIAKTDQIYSASKDLPPNDPGWVDRDFTWHPKGWYKNNFG
ncbi:hypothetical protein POM88_042805 [Heracleum sosnowskyi]|uniref:S-protein homolog n=1 Tax=Heracleum sosnowskyi TaxID=360622 RepID=A0AAD8HJ55_9APIA|nr:hypothetical protein POM88_042805 [Heracleum sosnowskyi]